MTSNIIVVCFCMIHVVLITNAIGDGIKDIKRWGIATQAVNSVRLEAEKSCDLNFDFSFDQDTFITGTELSELEHRNMDAYCGNTFAAVYELCQDADYGEAIANIESVSCAFDNSISTADANLEEGHLRFTFNWNTSNHRNTVKEYLMLSL